jgi:hypothetical protein
MTVAPSVEAGEPSPYTASRQSLRLTEFPLRLGPAAMASCRGDTSGSNSATSHSVVDLSPRNVRGEPIDAL